MRPVSRASCPSALSSTVFSCTSSAATISEPRASSTAPRMPTAAAASTTTGGGTRRRANGTTTRCARGRKTCSHSTSVPRLGFFEALKLDTARFDRVARRVELVPDVPEQEAARPPVCVDVRDRPLAERLVPRLDRLQARVDLADGLVAEVEQVGVEERHVVVDDPGAGHVGADDLAVRVRMVLVLDTEALPEHGARVVRDIACGEHVVAPVDAPVLVDDAPVVDGEAHRLRALDVRAAAETGDDDVALEVGRVGNGLAGANLDALVAVVLRHEVAEVLREEPEADRRLGEEHRHLRARADERGGFIGSDALVQRAEVFERAEVDDSKVVYF